MKLSKNTILVTGATGFLGSHLVKALVSLDQNIIILIRENSGTHRLKSVLSNIHCYCISSLNLYDGVSKPFIEYKNIDIIIHCATDYGHNNDIVNVFAANNILPIYLLQLANRYNVPVFINTDTVLSAEVNAYALSKQQFIEWVLYFINDRIKRFINFKIENFYGSDDNEAKFVNYVIKSCMENQKSILLTQGEQIRDFIYIEDVVAAYITILQNLHQLSLGFSQYDVTTGDPVSIRQFVEIVKQLTGCATQLDFGALPYRVNEKMNTDTDATALRALGWNCKYSLKQGILKMMQNLKI